MRRTEALQEVRMAMVLNILNRWESAELRQEEADESLRRSAEALVVLAIQSALKIQILRP